MRTINLQIPTQWIELSNAQLKFVSKLFLSDWAQKKYSFLAHAVIRFAGLRILNRTAVRSTGQSKYFIKKKGEKVFALSPNQLRAAAKKLEWLLKDSREMKPFSRILLARPCHYRL